MRASKEIKMKRLLRSTVAILTVFVMVVVASAKRHGGRGTTQGGFDYYMLALSWAPNYCAGHPTDKSAECRTGERTSFILHGLWPQANAGQSPVNCAGASPVSSALVREMDALYPNRGMVQHEWTNHGSCSGLSAADYFAAVKQAVRVVKVPPAYGNLSQNRTLSVRDIEQAFAAANNAPAGAFRISCHEGELVNVEACLTKDLGFQACTASARECPANQVLMRAVR
jgi:ribonuclease T2